MELHPEAVAEAASARRWYETIDPRVASSFAAALDRTFAQIDLRPRSFAPHLAGTRRAGLDGFPYAVVVDERDGTVRVLAVAHERRRPGYWHGRT